MSLLDVARQSRATGDPAPLLDYIAYAKWLGVTASVSEEGRLVFALPFREGLVGNPHLQALHGGVVSAYLETVMAVELIWRPESLSMPRTVTITIDYLRSARARMTFATARVTKLGRRTSTVQVIAWQEDEKKLVAQARGHFLMTT